MTHDDLWGYVIKTYQVDETGDASIDQYILEEPDRIGYSLKEFLEGFLVWANGPRWKEFLDDPAKFGDVPPK